jgi:hypothetical protein
LKVELIPVLGSAPIQDHSINTFRNNGKWQVLFSKLRRNTWYRVFVTLRDGGPTGTFVSQTVRALKTEDKAES